MLLNGNINPGMNAVGCDDMFFKTESHACIYRSQRRNKLLDIQVDLICIKLKFIGKNFKLLEVVSIKIHLNLVW